MMKRKIVNIDENICNGCGLCIDACHEGAIALVNGKAKLMREDYCDGLGDCLPVCPVNAIHFELREALDYDQKLTMSTQKAKVNAFIKEPWMGTLSQWPVQIPLVPVNAPFFQNAHLLIAADCCAYADRDFHHDVMEDKITLIGCTKLDAVDHTDKLTEIILQNDIKSITVARMEVPCCGGLVNATKMALQRSGKSIPSNIVTITAQGEVKHDEKISG